MKRGLAIIFGLTLAGVIASANGIHQRQNQRAEEQHREVLQGQTLGR